MTCDSVVGDTPARCATFAIVLMTRSHCTLQIDLQMDLQRTRSLRGSGCGSSAQHERMPFGRAGNSPGAKVGSVFQQQCGLARPREDKEIARRIASFQPASSLSRSVEEIVGTSVSLSARVLAGPRASHRETAATD